MKILTIIPIAKGIPREQLSYFSAKEVALGTLVTVPFGKRSIKGVVIETRPVREMKTAIKTSEYALRNITEIHHDEALPHSLFVAGQKTATFFAQPVGTVLKTMIPDQIFDYYIKNAFSPLPLGEGLGVRVRGGGTDIQAIQVPTTERISIYKTMIRENLAKKVSTMIVVPTIVHGEHFLKELSPGIEDKIFNLHSKKTKKNIEKTLTRLITSETPLVYITTAPYIGIVRNDWETIIIEESSSPHYRYTFKPIFDMRMFIENYAKKLGVRIIYGDTLLDPEIHHRIINREVLDIRTTWHIAKPEDNSIINMKPLPTEKKSFSLFDPKTKVVIAATVEEKTSMLFLTTRKGLAPMTMCSDCGTVVTCPVCDTPLVLHRKKSGVTEARIYLCHACMHTTAPVDHCRTCGGWKLTMLGISTGVITDELEKLFPKTTCHIVDADTVTPASVQKIIASWEKNRGSFLVATPMILPYLTTIPVGCLVSMDSLLSLPTLTGSYNALRTVMLFLEKISRTAIIQTRLTTHEVMQAIASENIFDFIKNELVSRKQFNYPPFKILLKISCSVTKSEAKNASEYLQTVFKEIEPDILMKKSIQPNQIMVTAIMKVDLKIWKGEESSIHDIIRSLDNSFTREVNPESVL